MKIKSLMTVNLFETLVYLAFAIFYFWMAAQVPYTHDDWDWGLEIGLQQLLTASINSRYTGNFLVVVMTRSELAKTLIMGGGYFLLPLVISGIVFNREDKWTSKDRLIGFILCNVLILSMDISIWQQTYGWVAGYANFGVSAIFLCIILRQILKVFNDRLLVSGELYSRSIILFSICLVGQLFIENVAIYILLISIFANVIQWYRAKRFSRENISIFLAALIGLVFVFSSSVYHTLWSTGEAVDGYRQLWINSETSIQRLITGCFKQIVRIPHNLYAKNVSVCMAIVVLLSILWIQNKQNRFRKNICIVVNGLTSVCLLVCSFWGTLVSSITSVLFFVVITAEIIFLFSSNKLLLCKMLFVWFSPICIILPLVMTSELGPRLFFTTNTILILFTLYLLSFYLKSTPRRMHCSVIVIVFACVLLLHYGTVYQAIGECNRQRSAIFDDAVENKKDTILLPQYPYIDYLWVPNPMNPKREQFFKEFYEIPESVSIMIDK